MAKLYATARAVGRRSSDDGYMSDSEASEMTEDQMLNGQHQMWSVHGDVYFPCDRAEKEVPPGQYLVQHHESKGTFLVRKTVNLDELLVLPDATTTRVLSAIDHFWNSEHKFREFKFLWKRGMLLWGPPGSGKTSCLQQLSKSIIDKGGISVYCTSPEVTADGLRIIRKIEPLRPIVVMIEDIDAIIDRHGETGLLSMLDGELQVDNVVFIATTNYPEKLDARFANRPSRFDEVIYIGMPKDEARRQYIIAKNPRLRENTEELAIWVKETQGYSLAHIKEVIVAVECLGQDLVAVLDRLADMKEKVSSDKTSDKPKFGFIED